MTKVLYHGGCADGFGAAFMAAIALGLTDEDLIPVSYGKPAPKDEVLGHDVYIVDFSYPAAELLALNAHCKTLTVLDHHKTAQKELEGLKAPDLRIEFDMERSGCKMAFDHFALGGRMRLLSDYIQDRDLWHWKLPYSREVSAYIAALPTKIAVWNEKLVEARLSDIIAGGSAIQMHLENQVRKMTRKSSYRTGELRGFGDIAIINICPTAPGSEILGKLAVGRPFAVGWYQKADGSFYYSLRSDESGEDVGAICAALKHEWVAFAGGGHKHAGGFSSMSNVTEIFGD